VDARSREYCCGTALRPPPTHDPRRHAPGAALHAAPHAPLRPWPGISWRPAGCGQLPETRTPNHRAGWHGVGNSVATHPPCTGGAQRTAGRMWQHARSPRRCTRGGEARRTQTDHHAEHFSETGRLSPTIKKPTGSTSALCRPALRTRPPAGIPCLHLRPTQPVAPPRPRHLL